MAEGIDGLHERLDRLEQALHPLIVLSSKVGVFADLAGDSASFAYAQAAQRGLDPITRGPELADLAGEALAPHQVVRLRRLIGALAELDHLTDEDLATLAREGARVAALLRQPAVRALLDGLDGPALSRASSAALAVVRTDPAETPPVGLWGALGAMGQPEMRKAVGYALGIARRLGASLG